MRLNELEILADSPDAPPGAPIRWIRVFVAVPIATVATAPAFAGLAFVIRAIEPSGAGLLPLAAIPIAAFFLFGFRARLLGIREWVLAGTAAVAAWVLLLAATLVLLVNLPGLSGSGERVIPLLPPCPAGAPVPDAGSCRVTPSP